MSNNIYDILKKIENLEGSRQTLTEGKTSKPDYIDIDKDGDKKEPMKKAAKDKAKGGMAEAVARVEQQLSEKYTGFKKLGEETEQFRTIKQGAKDFGMGVADFAQGLATMATGGKVKSIDQQMADAQRREQRAVDRAAKEAGYEVGTRYHNQLVKTNPAYRDEYMRIAQDTPYDKLDKVQQKLQLKYDPMGGPMDESAVEESGLQAYLGKKKYGEQGMQALQKAGREGASKEKMAKIRARHDKMDEDYESMMKARDKESRDKEFQADMDFVKSGGGYTDTSGTTYDRFGNPLADGGKTRAKDAKNRDYPVYRTPGVGSGSPDRSVPGKMDEGTYNEDMLSPKEKEFAALAEPKDKITYADKIAGAKKGVKKEGNKFSGNLMKARAQGLKKADLDGDGDMEPVRESAFAVADEEHQAAIQKMQIGKLLMREGWEEMQKYLEKKRGPESKGGAGKKAGTRYGGSAQKDDDEDTDGEGKPVEKKKGRPKGTGGGAKFSFKKPKD